MLKFALEDLALLGVGENELFSLLLAVGQHGLPLEVSLGHQLLLVLPTHVLVNGVVAELVPHALQDLLVRHVFQLQTAARKTPLGVLLALVHLQAFAWVARASRASPARGFVAHLFIRLLVSCLAHLLMRRLGICASLRHGRLILNNYTFWLPD